MPRIPRARRRILKAFRDEYTGRLSSFRQKWGPKLSSLEASTLAANEDFKRDYRSCLKPPSLNFGAVVSKSGLSEPAAAAALSRMVPDELSKRKDGKLRIYTVRERPDWSKWLLVESDPMVAKRPRGRPVRPPGFEEDVKVRSEIFDWWQDLGRRFLELGLDVRPRGGDGEKPSMVITVRNDVEKKITKLIKKTIEMEDLVKQQKRRLGLK